ncbi:TOMM system kinase/cyclase fusion protein [Photobacterium sp. TY1-4]|uniref:TOMM system kinase/cyclase fusion protein n=1 Tax=Photobacterium sp. TY1-4 TaxID=2899122 RepID=UPI0021C10973|nr:TOMM system kinase/cyclase fusion protein [Photobacterium sp. TY1-4]UXI02445.1 TOMM system kinase/cyclase fusion protein [Photobacterium sp. TY1-4]
MEKERQSQQLITSRFKSAEYELLEKIGEGGFGQVYKALHRRTQKFVAIKFLTLLETDNPDKKLRQVERFHRECDLIRRLNHPNVVSLLDKGQQGSDILYAVYEFIDGLTLKEYLQKHGPFTPSDAADVMACVLDALTHAHENGVIHRDIKPANIMLYQVGAKLHVKVLDFGIGTLKNDVRQTDYKTLTLTQETLGTPTYSAPEQLRGEPALPQTDLYIWGLVFIECLTGVPTLSGNSMAAVFHQQLSTSNIPLGPLASHQSAHLFRRVLNKKPLQRPGSTVELYQEFRKLNFSDLVVSNQRACAKPSSPEFENQTQINTRSPVYSKITERKQIAALSVILSTYRAQPRHHHVPPAISQDVIDMIHADQLHQCIDIAIRYGAYHVGTLGDTLLFYFGYPTLSDNDSRLCARAALDISSNLNGKKGQLFQNHGLVSELKVGIEIGIMQGFSGNSPEGKIANDALRLSRLAEPSQILCSEQAKTILENHLIFRSNKSSGPLHALDTPQYLLLSERVSEAFGFLRGTWKRSAFIGREDMFEALLNFTHEAEGTASYGQQELRRLVHLYGEAGIGKSRLVFEVQEQLWATPHWVAQCLPEYRNNALFPILKLIKARYELDSFNATDATAKLEQIIAECNLDSKTQSKSLCVLRAWLNLESTADEAAVQQQQRILAAMSPKQQKDCLFQILAHLLCQPQSTTASPEHPSSQLFICEDLHWSDPTTPEFIEYFVNSEPFLHGNHIWLNTSRKPLPSHLKQAGFKQIQLGKLTETNCRHMIESLFGDQTVSEAVQRLLIERCDGIPLFLEELVSNIQKQELVCKINGKIEFIGRDPEISIPVTLRESLQQRLDNLTFAKDTAQLAAAIGRKFDDHLLFAASEKDETQILGDLDELQKAGIIYVQRRVNGNRYIFKHAMIREAAYESAANIIALHKHIALALEDFATNQTGYAPERLAWHWMKANQPERAIPYYLHAGQQSSKAFIIDDAIHYYETALQLTKQHDQSPQVGEVINDTTVLAHKVSAHLGLADNLVRRAQHELARQHYDLALSELAETDQILTAQIHLKNGKSWETHHNHHRAMAAYDKAEQALAQHPAQNETWQQTQLDVLSAKLYVCYWRNDINLMTALLDKIEPMLEQAGDAYTQAKFYDNALHLRFRQTQYNLNHTDVMLAEKAYHTSTQTDDADLQAYCLFVLGFTLYFSQSYDQAGPRLQQALKLAKQQSDRTLQARCLTYLTILHRQLGDIDGTLSYSKQAMVSAKLAAMDDYIAIAHANQAWVAYKQHKSRRAFKLVALSHRTWQGLASQFPFPLQWLALLVELDLLTQQHLEAVDVTTWPHLMTVVESLIDSTQQRLPETITTPLKEVISLHQQRSANESRSLAPLASALYHSKRLGYL